MRLSLGASPPGRRPRLTSTTGGRATIASAPRTSPSPSVCQRSVSPTTTSPASTAAATTAAAPGSTQQRLCHNPERTLNGQRGIREQPTRVPAAGAVAWPREDQRHIERPSRPGRQFDRRPVVIGSDKRNQHRPRKRLSPDYHGHVARSGRKQARQHRISQQLGRAVDEHQIDVLLDGEADEVVGGSRRDEGRRPRRDSTGDQRRAAFLNRDGRGAELSRFADEPGQDQLLRRMTRKRLSEREQCVEATLAARRDQNRPLEHRRAYERELGILSKDRLLELLQGRARLDPEPVDERAPGRLIRLERLGLPTRAIEGEHQLTTKSFPQRMPGDELFQLRRRVRRDARVRGRRRSVARGPRASAPRSGRSPPARTTRRRGRRTELRARALAPHASLPEATAGSAPSASSSSREKRDRSSSSWATRKT